MTKLPAVDENDIKSVLAELLRHADLNIEIGLSACRQLNGTGRYEACEFGLKELLSRFVGSRHVGRVHAERLQAAVQRLPVADAIDYTSKFFDDDDIISNLDNNTRKSIHLLLWEQASKCQDSEQWNLSLDWYSQSLRLFQFGQTAESLRNNKEKSQNVSKLYRNKTLCLLNMGKNMEAEAAARRALEFDEDSMLSQFMLFKVLVARGKEVDAIKCISALAESPEKNKQKTVAGQKFDVKHALICLAAQHALEKCQRDVAMATLHHLASSGQNDKAKLTANRCLIRLYLTICDGIENETEKKEENPVTISEEKNEVELMECDEKLTPLTKDRNSLMEAAIQCVKNANKVLFSLKSNSKIETRPDLVDDVSLTLPGNESHLITDEEFNNEVTWFMKITWNMALQFKDDHKRMKELFLLCKEVLGLATVDQSILLRQKTCLLMCAACGLASARSATGKVQIEELEDVLSIVSQCREICRDLAVHENSSSWRNEDKSTVLLALYHFEALAKLTQNVTGKEPKTLHDLFQEICALPLSDAKTFETVAALSMEHPARHPEICKLSLKTALKFINTQLERELSESDKRQLLKKRSSLYRLLIDTMQSEGSPSDPTNKDESWICFNEVYQLVQSKTNQVPELDCLWFTVRCWNIGVRLFIASHVIEAEKWCALALRLLSQLERFKENYENKMNHAYREILAKKDVATSKNFSNF